MKKLILALSVFTLLLVSASKAWAEDQVLTLYFLGTTLKSDAYLANQSGWNRPELLATMFRENDQSAEMLQTQPFHPLFIGRWFPQIGSHSGRHHKYIINGAGTSPESNVFDLIVQLLGTVDPDIGIRNWTNIRLEGLDAVNLVHQNHPGDNLVVNLVGFSRGGISIMQMDRALSQPQYNYVTKINMLAFDPVPGGLDPVHRYDDDFVFTSKVNQFIGLYAEHERTYQFEPVVPKTDEDNDVTRMLLLRMPGSHETMMGNRQRDGHSFTLILADNNENEGYGYVEDVSLGIAEQLLTSYEWGEVPFDASANEIFDKASFSWRVNAMWDQDYFWMPGWAFGPMFGTFDWCYANLGRNHQLRSVTPLPVLHSRLAFKASQRHQPEWAWTWPCVAPWPVYVYYFNVEQVYFLNHAVPRRVDAGVWDVLQSFRGTAPADVTPPQPDQAELSEVSGNCSVTITEPPTATDNVDGVIVATTSDGLTYDEQGTYLIYWYYIDQAGNSATQTQTVVVDDVMPPAPDENPLPVIRGQCAAQVLTAPTASDNCSGTLFGATSDPLVYDQQGEHTITWSFYDSNGNSATQTQLVVVQDTVPPSLEVTASPNVLWPANHKLSEVNFTVAAQDNCTAIPAITLGEISSNGPDDQHGQGRGKNGGDDIQGANPGTEDYTILLRVERNGYGDERVYTIPYTAVDEAGNSTSASATVTVPHDMGNQDKGKAGVKAVNK